jgi:serine/threonine-protein kinase HipA
MRLYVYQHGALAGYLDTLSGSGITFSYDETFLSNPSSLPLSLSLPLQAKAFREREALPFFDGLLPEESARTAIAKFLGISEFSTMRLLAAIGGECAGSISILPEPQTIDQPEGSYLPLTLHEFTELTKPTSTYRLELEADARLSLAGAQGKICLHKRSNDMDKTDWLLPCNGAASSYILKPDSPYYSNLAINEYICSQLAQSCNINTCQTWLQFCPDPILITKRYDRIANKGMIERLFQEDSCQALGIPVKLKYQVDGGPKTIDLVTLIEQVSTNPAQDIEQLVQMFIFNYLIGNCDAHGKNFSILRSREGSIALAPAYDLVSTLAYPNLSRKLAMRFGTTYKIDSIQQSDFALLAAECSIGTRLATDLATNLVVKALENLPLITSLSILKDGGRADSFAAFLSDGITTRARQIGVEP